MALIRKLQRSIRLAIVGVGAGLLAAATLVQPAIRQPAAYHRFADRRVFWGMANFLDVASNVGFLVVGVAGLVFLWRHRRDAERFVDRSERWHYAVAFAGVALTCFGSMYYHIQPNNERLMWDRLPMTLIFVSILSATVAERIGARAGAISLAVLTPLGIASVIYWRIGEAGGAGDLRFYLLMQLLPVLVIPLIVLLFPPRYSRSRDLALVLGVYLLSKFFEALDRPLFRAGHLVSGHTLKHLVAALAVYLVLRMLRLRKTVVAPRAFAAAASQLQAR